MARIPEFGLTMKDRLGELYYLRITDKCIDSDMRKRRMKNRTYAVKMGQTGMVDRTATVENCPIHDVYRATARGAASPR